MILSKGSVLDQYVKQIRLGGKRMTVTLLLDEKKEREELRKHGSYMRT